MTVIKELVAELVGMFVGDARLTFAVLLVVAAAAALVDAVDDPLIGGAVLLGGCLVLLVENVRRSSQSRFGGRT